MKFVIKPRERRDFLKYKVTNSDLKEYYNYILYDISLIESYGYALIYLIIIYNYKKTIEKMHLYISSYFYKNFLNLNLILKYCYKNIKYFYNNIKFKFFSYSGFIDKNYKNFYNLKCLFFKKVKQIFVFFKFYTFVIYEMNLIKILPFSFSYNFFKYFCINKNENIIINLDKFNIRVSLIVFFILSFQIEVYRRFKYHEYLNSAFLNISIFWNPRYFFRREFWDKDQDITLVETSFMLFVRALRKQNFMILDEILPYFKSKYTFIFGESLFSLVANNKSFLIRNNFESLVNFRKIGSLILNESLINNQCWNLWKEFMYYKRCVTFIGQTFSDILEYHELPLLISTILNDMYVLKRSHDSAFMQKTLVSVFKTNLISRFFWKNDLLNYTNQLYLFFSIMYKETLILYKIIGFLYIELHETYISNLLESFRLGSHPQFLRFSEIFEKNVIFLYGNNTCISLIYLGLSFYFWRVYISNIKLDFIFGLPSYLVNLAYDYIYKSRMLTIFDLVLLRWRLSYFYLSLSNYSYVNTESVLYMRSLRDIWINLVKNSSKFMYLLIKYKDNISYPYISYSNSYQDFSDYMCINRDIYNFYKTGPFNDIKCTSL